MSRKLVVLALCSLFIVQSLAGCAGMSQEEQGAATGVAGGAALGAILGGALGGWRGAAIGAGAGALVGGVVGWQIGAYQARKTREAPEAAKAYSYTPQQGTLAKIEITDAAPKQLKPGDQVVLQTEYTVLAPPQQGQVTVKEVRTILFNNQVVQTLEKVSTLESGTYQSEQPLTLPRDVKEGRYTVTTKVEPVQVDKGTGDQADTAFLVRPAAR